MWFPTYQKMHSTIDALVDECRLIDKRLKEHEEQHQTFGAMLDRSGSFAQDLIEMRDLYFVVNGGLIETSLGMQFGKVTPRQANKVIRPASKRIAELKLILDQLEAGAAMGREVFQQRFGGSSSAIDAPKADNSKERIPTVAELKAQIPMLQAKASDERLSDEARRRAARLVKMLGGKPSTQPVHASSKTEDSN